MHSLYDRSGGNMLILDVITTESRQRLEENALDRLLQGVAGGSVRDDHVIETCDKYGIAMAFTGIRLFHH